VGYWRSGSWMRSSRLLVIFGCMSLGPASPDSDAEGDLDETALDAENRRRGRTRWGLTLPLASRRTTG
jgi:hypothetical protein